jgi:hypothetical protein
MRRVKDDGGTARPLAVQVEPVTSNIDQLPRRRRDTHPSIFNEVAPGKYRHAGTGPAAILGRAKT